jgi:hypothetical protein
MEKSRHEDVFTIFCCVRWLHNEQQLATTKTDNEYLVRTDQSIMNTYLSNNSCHLSLVVDQCGGRLRLYKNHKNHLSSMTHKYLLNIKRACLEERTE